MNSDNPDVNQKMQINTLIFLFQLSQTPREIPGDKMFQFQWQRSSLTIHVLGNKADCLPSSGSFTLFDSHNIREKIPF